MNEWSSNGIKNSATVEGTESRATGDVGVLGSDRIPNTLHPSTHVPSCLLELLWTLGCPSTGMAVPQATGPLQKAAESDVHCDLGWGAHTETNHSTKTPPWTQVTACSSANWKQVCGGRQRIDSYTENILCH